MVKKTIDEAKLLKEVKMPDKESHGSHLEESSEDLLRYAQALNWLKTAFPGDHYDHFKQSATALADEIKRRVTKPPEPESE